MTCSSAAAAMLVITNILPPRIRKSRRDVAGVCVFAMSENPRVMWFVARHARFAARVLLDIHGRIPLRLAGVRRVAVGAERRRDRQRGLLLILAPGMRAERAMTRLAGDTLVPRLGAKFDDVHVALGAGGLPRMHRLFGADVVDRVGAVVTQPAEALGHQLGAGDRKDQHAGQKQRREANQMLDILETLHASRPPS